MQKFQSAPTLGFVAILAVLATARSGSAQYNADDCATVAGTLNMHWRATGDSTVPCFAIVTTDGTFEDAADEAISMSGIESTDAACMNLGQHYDLFLSAEKSSLAGYDTTGGVPMFLDSGPEDDCFAGVWHKDEQDYVVHIAKDAFLASAAPLCGDVNVNQSVSAADALLVLKAGVGQPVTLHCPSDENLATCVAQLTTCSDHLSDAEDELAEISERTCGDGVINVPGEHCDEDDFGGFDCDDFLVGSSGQLACTETCHFDTRDCRPCDGAFVGSACWFQGDWGKSCTEVCAAEDRVFDAEGAAYIPIGDIAGPGKCAEVAALLPLPSDQTDCGFYEEPLWGGGPSYSDGAGCVADRGSCLDFGGKIDRIFVDAQGPLTADAKDTLIARICACR